MTMSGFFRAGIAVLVAIIAEIIIEAVVPMDVLYLNFKSLLTHLPLSPSWVQTITGTLNQWTWYDRSFVIIIIALIVWMFTFAFSSADYTKQYPGR